MNDVLTELLQPYREAEGDPRNEKAPRLSHTAIQLVDDPAAQKVLAAWSVVPISWKAHRRKAPEDLKARWNWLWLGARIDMAELSEKAGVSLVVLEGVLERLKGCRLIYPDGSISAWGQGVLDGTIAEAVRR